MYVKSSVNPAFVKYRKKPQNDVGKVTFVAGGFWGCFYKAMNLLTICQDTWVITPYYSKHENALKYSARTAFVTRKMGSVWKSIWVSYTHLKDVF